MQRIEFQYGLRVWILYFVGAGVGAYVDAYFLPTRAWLHACTRTRVCGGECRGEKVVRNVISGGL